MSFASQRHVFTLQSKFARECYREHKRHLWIKPMLVSWFSKRKDARESMVHENFYLCVSVLRQARVSRLRVPSASIQRRICIKPHDRSACSRLRYTSRASLKRKWGSVRAICAFARGRMADVSRTGEIEREGKKGQTEKG